MQHAAKPFAKKLAARSPTTPSGSHPDETQQCTAGRNLSRRSPTSSIPTESSSSHPDEAQQPTSRRNPPVHCLAKLSRRDPAARIVTKSNNRSPDQTQQLAPSKPSSSHLDENKQSTPRRYPEAHAPTQPQHLTSRHNSAVRIPTKPSSFQFGDTL